ncbi:Holliday junction branch migration protein RuvA [Guggenheimella bovis]
MIALIQGEVLTIDTDGIVLLTQNIGYRIFMSNRDLSSLEEHQDTKVFTELIVREDDMSLFGFLSDKDREMFNALRSVTGIGAKTAQAILGMLSAKEVIQLVIEENTTFLMKVPGIGKKTAQRIILELKDKFLKQYGDVGTFVQPVTQSDPSIDEVRDALLSLGYDRSEVTSVLKKIERSDSVEEMLKAALKELVRW